jgi:hypothetical protein
MFWTPLDKRSCLGVDTSGKGKDVRKGYMYWKYYALVYENGKMRPVEAIPVTGEREIKENDRGGEFNYDIL